MISAVLALSATGATPSLYEITRLVITTAQGEMEKSHGRRLASACDATDGLEYALFEGLYGESLTKCLCANAPEALDTSANTESDAFNSKMCNCKDEILASSLFQLAAGSEADLKKEIDAACGGDAPCFGRDTFAVGVDGLAVPMASLRSGDLVMDSPTTHTRVIVNQHAAASVKSALLEISHANGELSVTPDHVIEVDGSFVAARNAVPGAKLGQLEVSRVVSTSGEVINPLTASGKILTQGGVLATTYPEWIANYMLSSYLFPLPLSLSNAISYLFPETTQQYYDTAIEAFTAAHHPMHLKAALPAPLVPFAFLFADVALSAGFLAFAAASPAALVAVGLAVASKGRK